MIARHDLTVGYMTLAVAYTTLASAALLMPPERQAVVGVAIVGHVISALVLIRFDRVQGTTSARPRCVVTLATAGACGTAELAGWWLCIRAGEPEFASWFLLALSFAVAATVVAGRQEPGDATFTAQLAFHGVLLMPLVALAAQGAVRRQALLHASWSAVSGTGPLLRAAVLVGSILGPGLVALMVAAVAINFAQPSARRRPAWNALLVHEAVFLVILSRWALAL